MGTLMQPNTRWGGEARPHQTLSALERRRESIAEPHPTCWSVGVGALASIASTTLVDLVARNWANDRHHWLVSCGMETKKVGFAGLYVLECHCGAIVTHAGHYALFYDY